MLYRASAAALLSVSLAACAGTGMGSGQTAPAPSPADTSAMEQSCLTAVGNQVGENQVSVLRVEPNARGDVSTVYVRVVGEDTPYVCHVEPDGQIQALMHLGQEVTL